MSQYKVVQVSQEAPREWNGPHGIVYYIKTKLEGHTKPVSIGKKKPDALKAGDTVFGTIEPSDLPEDKFKADPMPQGQTSFVGTERPAYKDNSDGQRQGMCFNNAAHYVTANYPKIDAATWAENVYTYANALYLKGDLGKTETTELAKQDEPLPEPPEQSIVDEFGEGSEPISLENIPF